ncbi:leukotriene A4 hydrolase C-terminal domain-containing protein [Haliscomenobacter sp.]|uniref:leukotriene A4 hydrolase C-terminal domain-containing protein n=1 Tax=Haliscomenobacter sp. TaxID=2717303 RepID=UPI0035935614
MLGQALRVKILPDTRFVKIAYAVEKDAEGLLYMDANQSLTGKPFVFSQSESLFARSWLLLQDAPQVRFTFSAKVKLPKGDSSLVLMSAPDNPKQVNPSGIYEFHQKNPLPSYLMSLAVGPLQYTNLGKRTGFYAEKPLISKAKQDLAPVEKMLEASEKCFGEYPWERYDVLVLPERFPFGGMENPCITYASGTIITGDSSLVNVVIHEICHSWFGNLVTHSNWADIALTEGFTTWGELTVNRMLNGDELGDMLWINEIAALKEELDGYTPEQTKLYREMKNPEGLFDNIPYTKGALFLEALKNQIGLERTLAFLNKYLKKFAWKDASVEGFLPFLKEEIGPAAYTTLKADAWFYEPGLPSNSPSFESPAFQAIGRSAKDWKNVKELSTATWKTPHWLHFLNSVYEQGVSVEQLKQLEATHHLTQKNSEIKLRFYRIAVKYGFEEVFPAMEAFLMKVGRKKLIVPIYKELCGVNKAEYAEKLIKKANYHPITQVAIDTDVTCVKK